MTLSHALQALTAVASREVIKFLSQTGRLFSALVRPTLWLVVFSAGFQNVFGVSIIPPYDTYIEYQVYVVPGLLGITLLFNGMNSSLSMVYDKEMGMMRLLLTAPLPRWYLLFCKLCAGTLLSVLQSYTFLIITYAYGVDIPLSGWLYIFLPLTLSGMMLGALGLLLSVHIKQLENFAGTINFVIFPMFFISSALYPLWKLEESGAVWVHWLAMYNPFTHAIELIRFALYGQFNGVSFMVVLGAFVLFFTLAIFGYDPQRGILRKAGRPATA
ncbi:ABC transporter permease [Beggiatoa leptomitoformis]|uniref:Transport permease protein n=1 Tax=Beggiatoa leptomitoformis TaxID=288004 RepID=A0A2N9YD17_9GAMM|nr:ABC transporter permease [Beggiatoa leptomitoformis]ALG69193.1 ABC transporter permease [Beggiatoa leptomitoformis]AUI68378.1 ABC transporter permease [Beggiatoa leptomitoformis]